MPDGVEVLIIVLLALESVLIVLTLVVIYLGRHEARARVVLLDKMVAAVRVLTRHEYFSVSVEAIQDAHESVVGLVTGSRPTDEDREAINRLLRAIKERVEGGVTVRYLLPLGQERLQMGHLYESAGADVRYHPGLLVGDARYMVVDDQTVVIGFPERPGEEEPTRRGQRIHSETVAKLFHSDWDARWSADRAQAFRDYLRAVVQEVGQAQPRLSSRRIADDLRVPKDLVDGVRTSP